MSIIHTDFDALSLTQLRNTIKEENHSLWENPLESRLEHEKALSLGKPHEGGTHPLGYQTLIPT